MNVLNRRMLHIEGIAVFVVSLYLYATTGFSWWWFFLLLLAPDLSALGYLKDRRVGAVVYNVFHTYSFPLLLMLVSKMTGWNVVFAAAVIWLAHIGMDRALGYGLKYPSDFKHTHLQRV
ncbi:DUF4260 domain-containing protein [Geomicrobium sp. JCM 19039]|uniref:DUF4260 domain-containing protein n=1 Tax=Geomicrobium sp. JCM 19039 TaxID=1460636 RepID=UPI0027D79732|nr:DUF4260 domain-containing protein [Geomicrobium sp. JCM 19039]